MFATLFHSPHTLRDAFVITLEFQIRKLFVVDNSRFSIDIFHVKLNLWRAEECFGITDFLVSPSTCLSWTNSSRKTWKYFSSVRHLRYTPKRKWKSLKRNFKTERKFFSENSPLPVDEQKKFINTENDPPKKNIYRWRSGKKCSHSQVLFIGAVAIDSVFCRCCVREEVGGKRFRRRNINGYKNTSAIAWDSRKSILMSLNLMSQKFW